MAKDGKGGGKVGRMLAAYHLFGYQNDSLQGESPPTHVKQVFERGAQQIDNEDVMETFLAEVVHVRDTGYKDGC